MSAKKILMIVGDFSEDYEVMVPYQILTMVGHQVDTVCPARKPGDFVKTAIHDFEGDQTYSEKPGHRFAINADFASIKESDYDALVLPGGRAPEYLRLNPRVLSIVQHFFEENKAVAAICHGPQILAAAGVLQGRNCTAYFACEPEITRAGATWSPSAADEAFTDGNLVTAVAWPGHPSWMKRFLALLGSIVEV